MVLLKPAFYHACMHITRQTQLQPQPPPRHLRRHPVPDVDHMPQPRRPTRQQRLELGVRPRGGGLAKVDRQPEAVVGAGARQEGHEGGGGAGVGVAAEVEAEEAVVAEGEGDGEGVFGVSDGGGAVDGEEEISGHSATVVLFLSFLLLLKLLDDVQYGLDVCLLIDVVCRARARRRAQLQVADAVGSEGGEHMAGCVPEGGEVGA